MIYYTNIGGILMASYINQCGSCINYEFEGDNRKGYCEWYKAYYYPTDSCNHQKSRNEVSTCYITTVMCDILEYPDDCYYLNQLRDFRNNVMQNDKKYADILYEYDTVGPLIAQNLKRDFTAESDKEFIIQLFNFYILPTVRYIQDNKYEEAISRYQEMTKDLEEYYNIKPTNIVPDNYDFTTGGHGKVNKKIK